MDKIIPEIGVSNMDTSLEFYSKLGFTKNMEGTVDDKGLQWCSLEFGDSQVWLQREDVDPDFQPGAPKGNGVTIYLRVDDVDAAYERTKTVGLQINILKEIETHSYGLREFKLADPDGYVWTIYHPVDEGSEESSGQDE